MTGNKVSSDAEPSITPMASWNGTTDAVLPKPPLEPIGLSNEDNSFSISGPL